MTVEDAPAPPRRPRRGRRGAAAVSVADGRDRGILTLDEAPAREASRVGAAAQREPVLPGSGTPASTAPAAGEPDDASKSPRALAWVDDRTLTGTPAPADLTAAASPYLPVGTDLLADAPPRSPLRAGVIAPAVVLAGLLAAYSGTTLLWPLHAVAPTVTAVHVQPVAAPVAAPAWPSVGSAAVAVGGIAGAAASSTAPDQIASITKVVTALVVLDEMPLAAGEQGPQFRFTAADRSRYWQYRSAGESALDVPVGGSLTQYQMLEGMLVGSANNYADRLAQNLWPSDAVFASAANAWLQAHGVPEVTVVEPTGMDPRNSASAAALLTLAKKALAHPVIAEIVAKPTVELPGAGVVENTNGLLADPGVIGIKTGTLATWNLLSAKDVEIGETTVRLYASVLGQPDDEARLAATRALYAQLEQELQPEPSVAAGSLAGYVETRWGEKVEILTDADASVVVWNGGAGTVSTAYDLGDRDDAGDTVGTLTVTGPLDAATVDLLLAEDVDDPSPWWRLTHPLDLFGLND